MMLVCLCVFAFSQWAFAEAKTAVIVVDVQADFTTAHKGSLAVAGTDQAFLEKVAQATKKFKEAGLPVYATQDWHPAGHVSFAVNNKGTKPFQLATLQDGRKQMMWPAHCVQGTDGAKLLLDNALFTKVVQKGMDTKFDSYSGFRDDGGADTVMDKTLKAAGIKNLIVYGIAIDYCIKFTVLDGIAAGYNVVVIKDLSAEITPETAAEGWKAMKEAGVTVWPSLDLDKAKAL